MPDYQDNAASPAFDDDSRPCGVTMPDIFGDDPEPSADNRLESQEIVAGFIRLLESQNLPPLAIGQQVVVLAYLTGQSDCRTQRELARRLNVSPGRVCQILRDLPSDLQPMRRLQRRTANHRGHR